jgi:hypothetical protein
MTTPTIAIVAAASLLGLACEDGPPTDTTPDSSGSIALARVSGDSQVGEAGGLLGDFLVFRVVDRTGAPIGGLRVEWEVVSGGGKVSGKRHETDAAGLAAGNLTLGPEPGDHVARAVVRDSLSIAFTAFAVPPSPGEPAAARSGSP